MASMEQDKAPRRKTASMPFIMPDGRPLGLFLTETNHMTSHGRSDGKRRGRAKEPSHGWSSSHRPAVSTATTQEPSQPRPSRTLTDAEHAELIALEKVGQRRQRRWLNDKLLRDMAPPLTAKDMESLFKPAPFGDTGYVSAFTLAAAPEHAALWDLFRSVDSDKQNRVLLKWEEHVKELRAEVIKNKANYANTSEGGFKKADSAVVAATTALHGWAAVGPRGRKALRRAPRGCAEELEAPILRLVESTVETEVVLELEDGFQRLLAHSIAKFHFLFASSRDGPAGKEVVVRKKRITTDTNLEKIRSTSKSPQRRSSPSPARIHHTIDASPSTLEGITSPLSHQTPPETTPGNTNSATPGSSTGIANIQINPTTPAAVGTSPDPSGSAIPRITCLDILYVLDDELLHGGGGGGGLTAKTLQESLCHDHSSLVEVAHVNSHSQYQNVAGSPVIVS